MKGAIMTTGTLTNRYNTRLTKKGIPSLTLFFDNERTISYGEGKSVTRKCFAIYGAEPIRDVLSKQTDSRGKALVDIRRFMTRLITQLEHKGINKRLAHVYEHQAPPVQTDLFDGLAANTRKAVREFGG